jgi:acyl-CoA thioesterase FadM
MSAPPPPLPGWSIHRYERMVDEFDIDLLGHLNNVAAMALFERARWDMITSRGYGIETVRATGQAPVIVAVDVQFRREVTLRQLVTIETYTSFVASKVGTVTQLLRTEDGAPNIVATYTIGLFDLTTRRLVPPTAAWRRACGDASVGA